MDPRHHARVVAISSVLIIAAVSALALSDDSPKRKYSDTELDKLMANVWQKCKTDLE